ncbi:hypothetical protein WMY93_009943 [Mugilogobius chulae]|uniref:Peptidase aspartic putative domain-containing protein n=1 Tax=Mugilogobius chulae TaxID=88201 RepID=A0AAW0P9P4_9GOBI
MAESKTLEELKVERTTAKRLFSRLTNNIVRTHMEMSMEELQENFKKLTIEGSRVMEANEDLKAAYLEERDETEGAPGLSDLQIADIEKTEKECEQRLKEVKLLVRETLWASYGEKELLLALQVAEAECENVSSTQPDTPLEAYDFMLTNLEKLVHKAKEEHQIWNRWAPPAEQRDFDRRLRELELRLPKLVWRREWEALQKQGEPTGSREVRKFQLLDSLDEKVAKDLRLSTYTTADEILESSRIGMRPEEPLVTKSIESKLPESLKKDWLTYAADQKNAVNPQIRFDKLLEFLQSQESIYEQLEQLRDIDPAKEKTKFATKYARTKTTKSTSEAGCIICGDTRHKKKLYICRKFRTQSCCQRRETQCSSSEPAREKSITANPAEIHLPVRESRVQRPTPLSSLSIAQKPVQRSSKSGPVRAEGRRYTEDQEAFLSKLPPELAQQCRDAFCNVISRAYNSAADEKGLLEGNGLHEYPVILMLLDVTANDGQRVGTLIDLASDTNYITHRAASKLNLQSENVTLVVHGVGGMKASVATKRYLLKIRVSTPRGTLKSHQLICYGLDRIAEVHRHVPAHKLQKIFPDVALKDLVRPKEIHLLISHKEGQLVPQKVRSIGDLVLWDGPLGKTVGGTHPDLFEEVT